MKVFEGTPNEYYMDGYLHQNMLKAKELVLDDWDMIFVIDGGEGSGKSVLAGQLAFFVDPTYNLDRCCFTPESLKAAIYKASKGQAIVYDEAYGGLNSAGTMGAINRMLTKMFSEIRDRNLFIFIVIPPFFDLTKNIAIWRTRALIHVYHDDDFRRGYFAFYNREKKKYLYINGKKFYEYNNPGPNFKGRFTKHWVLDEKLYKQKKHKDTEGQDDVFLGLHKLGALLKAKIAINVRKPELGLTQQQIAEIIDVSNRTIRNYLDDYKEKTNNALIEGDVPDKGQIGTEHHINLQSVVRNVPTTEDDE